MKIVALGDTHGRIIWKDIITKELPTTDKIVFIGDYVDSFDISAEQQINNLIDILQFKRDNPEKVVLLIGNHDYHYFSNTGHRYSGFQSIHSGTLKFIYEQALKDGLLQMCYQYEDYLFTHAGVSETWYNTNNQWFNSLWGIQENVNMLFTHKPHLFEFTPGEEYNNYGDETCQTPIWIRPHSLKMSHLKGFIHIVGHTQTDIQIGKPVTMIDCLGKANNYLIIEDDNMNVGIL